MTSKQFKSWLKLALAIAVISLSCQQAAAAPIPALPALSAKSYILIDARTGERIIEHQADQLVEPASLAKVMTSYVLAGQIAIGSVRDNELVKISPKAWSQNKIFRGSSLMFIEVGKKVRLDNLHLGLVISSGNDASIAIAEHIAGSEQDFVALMNRKAQQLGMTNTRFANAHGLPDEGQHTTARDMALLAQALIRNYPEQYALYRKKEFVFNGIRQRNRNRLLWSDPYVDGVKTGHTEAAGYCLVASRERHGMRLIAVTMNSSSKMSRIRDSIRLLSYGFHHYRTVVPHKTLSALKKSRVWGAQTTDVLELGIEKEIALTLTKKDAKKVKSQFVISDPIIAPIKALDRYGEVIISLDKKELARTNLVALQDIESSSIVSHTVDMIRLFFYQLFK